MADRPCSVLPGSGVETCMFLLVAGCATTDECLLGPCCPETLWKVVDPFVLVLARRARVCGRVRGRPCAGVEEACGGAGRGREAATSEVAWPEPSETWRLARVARGRTLCAWLRDGRSRSGTTECVSLSWSSELSPTPSAIKGRLEARAVRKEWGGDYGARPALASRELCTSSGAVASGSEGSRRPFWRG
ncbi:hypothetical protein Esti_004968 [Eimeria stiedai]